MPAGPPFGLRESAEHVFGAATKPQPSLVMSPDAQMVSHPLVICKDEISPDPGDYPLLGKPRPRQCYESRNVLAPAAALSFQQCLMGRNVLLLGSPCLGRTTMYSGLCAT